MKTFSCLLVVVSLLHGVNALACRPNIYQIQNDLVLTALSKTYEEKNHYITELTKIQVKDTQMFWVENNPGLDCPDKYIISYELEYKECFSIEATVTSFKGEKSVEFGGVNSCIPDHP